MGQKKYQSIKLIENERQRLVAFSKRKKGILKKAMECSLLCGKSIYLVIYDQERSKMTQYKSTTDFTAQRVQILSNTQLINVKDYTNKDYVSQFASDHYKTVMDDQENSDIEQDIQKSVLQDKDAQNEFGKNNIEMQTSSKKVQHSQKLDGAFIQAPDQ